MSSRTPPSTVARRSTRGVSYLIFFGLFALVVFVSHLWALDLPYYWDEAGQFVPAALDLMHGSWIPHSAPATIHPPAVAAWLAAWWKIAGFHPAVTRSAMLFLAAAGILAAFLLAIELLPDLRGAPALLVAALLCASPLYFAQSLLAQLDAPAMLFTSLALLLFLRNRIPAAALVSVALVLVKETGAVVPMVLFLWLAGERRWREAAWFLAPPVALAAWIVRLHGATGEWLGSPAFLHYNLIYPLHPARFALALLRRIYYLFFANFHWIGTQAILLAWRTSGVFRSRSWRIALWTAAAHVFTVTLFGGAVLERYLLPAIPILYTAMAAGLSLLRRTPRLVCAGILLFGLAASNFINPPYPFPYEDNLAFSDFLRLQRDAAQYLARRFPRAAIASAWPLTAELAHPELGFVHAPMRVATLPNLSADAIRSVDWSRVEVLVVYSRRWDPAWNLLHWQPLARFWRQVAGYTPELSSTEALYAIPYPNYAHFARRGQWVDVYASPAAWFSPDLAWSK